MQTLIGPSPYKKSTIAIDLHTRLKTSVDIDIAITTLIRNYLMLQQMLLVHNAM